MTEINQLPKDMHLEESQQINPLLSVWALALSLLGLQQERLENLPW